MLQKMQLARGAAISAALAVTVVVSGCGGGSSNKNEAVVASFQLGQANYSALIANRNGSPSVSTLSAPSSVATNGTLFVIADTNNNRIVGYGSVPTSNAAVATFQYGQADFNGNTQDTAVNHPTKVSFSKDGSKMLVVDSRNNRVLIWNNPAAAAASPTFAAPDVIIGDGDTSTTATSLRSPTGASFLGNDGLVVADSGNNRVLIFPGPLTTGEKATVVLGQRDFDSGLGLYNCPQDTNLRTTCTSNAPVITSDTLYTPYDVWSDGGSLLISDQGNNRVLYFNTLPTGAKAVTTGSGAGGTAGQPADFVIGQSVMTSQGYGAGSAALHTPRGIWTDPNSGYIYVADAGNNRVLAFPTPFGNGGGASAVYGQGDYSHVTANDDNQNNVSDLDSNSRPEASDRTLNGPQGMGTFARTGGLNMVYVADTQNSRVMAFPAY